MRWQQTLCQRRAKQHEAKLAALRERKPCADSGISRQANTATKHGDNDGFSGHERHDNDRI